MANAYTIHVFSFNTPEAVMADVTSMSDAVIVPHRELSGEALDRLIAEFVSRDGTDYDSRRSEA
jgi:hypothetical protein